MAKRGDKKPGGDARGRSQRQLRVGEELRHRLAAAFERGVLHDPVLEGVTLTVTEVKVSSDLTNATCYVIPLRKVTGDGGEVAPVIKALSHAAGYLRHLVSADLGLRVSPRLAFAADRSFDVASRVEALLRSPKVQEDLKAGQPAAEPEDGDGPA